MKRGTLPGLSLGFVVLFALTAFAQDKVELLNGISMKGKVVKITDEAVTFKLGSAEKDFPLDQVHAVTQDGERRAINEKGEKPKPAAKTEEKEEKKEKEVKEEKKEEKADEEKKETAGKPHAKKKEKKRKLSARQIDSLIKKEGKAKPDWWDDVKLEVPSTLTLTEWAPPAGAKADAEKWPSTYIWDKIVPNPDRWKEAVKLVHECLKKAAGNAAEESRIKLALADYYRNLLNDYPRAACLYRELAEGKSGNFAVEMGLADCYAQLGGDSMAAALYKNHEKTVGRDADVVRGYYRIGETKQAIKVGKALIASSDGLNKAISLLAAGDAARAEGDYKDALGFYEQVKDVSVPDRGDAKKTEDEGKRVDLVKQRAETAARMVKLYEDLDLKKVPDGTYNGKSRGYASDIEVAVEIKGGAIEKVEVTKQKETRFYTALTSIPEQIVENQSLKVDAITSATVSSDAVVAAVGVAIEEALKK